MGNCGTLEVISLKTSNYVWLRVPQRTAVESVEEIFLKGNLFACPSPTKDCVINRKLGLQQLLVVCVWDAHTKVCCWSEILTKNKTEKIHTLWCFRGDKNRYFLLRRSKKIVFSLDMMSYGSVFGSRMSTKSLRKFRVFRQRQKLRLSLKNSLVESATFEPGKHQLRKKKCKSRLTTKITTRETEHSHATL